MSQISPNFEDGLKEHGAAGVGVGVVASAFIPYQLEIPLRSEFMLLLSVCVSLSRPASEDSSCCGSSHSARGTAQRARGTSALSVLFSDVWS